MEKLDLSKLKLASSSLGERIKTSSAQMGRTISSKMKEILQTPTPESKAVDEATAETLPEPNWGLNLRICAMISRTEYDGTEIVRAIKKKLAAARSPPTQLLSLDLLETCASNCEKVFSEVASEKVLDDMVRLIEDPRTDHGVRVRALQLIRGWGESNDLDYLPVFRQTYMNLKSREFPPPAQEESFPSDQRNLESYLGEQQLAPSERQSIPNSSAANEEVPSFITYGFQSNEEKKEHLLVARNSLDILSSILNSDTEPKPIKDDLTISMLENCKQSLPIVQRIIESTSDDEVMLFDALNLHEELQNVVSRHSELVAALESGEAKDQSAEDLSGDSNTTKSTLGPDDANETADNTIAGNTNETTDNSIAGSTNETTDNSIAGSTRSNKSGHQEESAEKSSKE
ncbi:TOM1-like protein 2 [Salvia hispanica]|uniref:TOM1-like protein 2 n=1 Tax=Salvia hispanica TaxID=49212 RepID=UPI00200903FF|nr:TOM1-like protein 2 [Salvia hispanica]